MTSTQSTRVPSRLLQVQLSRPVVLHGPETSFRPPSRVTLSDGHSHSRSTSPREKAYRRLVNNAAKKPLIHVNLRAASTGGMGDSNNKVPVVKLKVGEIVPSFRRSHTVAQMNNLRSNFGNYSHYRLTEKRLPSLPDSSHGSSPTDGSVVFILRGKTGSKSPKRSESQSSPASARSPVSSNTAPSPLFKRTFRLVKSTDYSAGTNNTGSNSLKQISDYEIRGSSLMKGYARNKNKEQYVTNGQVKHLVNKSSASLPSRPNSYLSGKVTAPSKPRGRSALDLRDDLELRNGLEHRNGLDSVQALTTAAPTSPRKVNFDETKSLSNPKLLHQDRINPNKGRRTFGTRGAVPLQLTVKNLEMFEYLSDTKTASDVIPIGQKTAVPHHRVLSWVQNTPPISDIPEEPEMDPLTVDSKTEINVKDSENSQTPKFVLNVIEES